MLGFRRPAPRGEAACGSYHARAEGLAAGVATERRPTGSRWYREPGPRRRASRGRSGVSWPALGSRRPAREGRSVLSPGDGLFSAPGCPGSIVGAAAFHFRVRDENGWFHRALTTRTTYYRASACEPQARAARAAAAGPSDGRRSGALEVRGSAGPRAVRAAAWARRGVALDATCVALDAKRAEQVLRPVIGLVAGEGFEPPTFGL